MIPETAAAERIASMIGEYLSPTWLTDTCLKTIGAKVVAHRMTIRSVFDELDADPARIPDRDVVLRQQATSTLTDAEALDEDIHLLQRELADKRAMRARIGSLPEYDPDEVAADRADVRAREQAQDEAANRQAVRP